MNEEEAKIKLQKVVNKKLKEEKWPTDTMEIARLTSKNAEELTSKYGNKLPWILACIDAFWDLVLKEVWNILYKFFHATSNMATIEEMEDMLIEAELKVMRHINKEDAQLEADRIECMFKTFKAYVKLMKHNS